MSTHVSRLQSTRARHLTIAEALAAGRALRAEIPRSSHRDLTAAPAPRDPLGILAAQNATRLDHLVPLRLERMLTSPFAFYRGTAGIMAADLAAGASTGIDVVACGDAHISNFGLFASPQRTLVFDLNDFDEAAVSPWEWDVKRLVASVVIGAGDAGHSEKQVRRAALTTASAYRTALRDMMKIDALERYYTRVDTDELHPELDSAAQKVLGKATRQARRRTSRAYLEKITARDDDGTLLIIEDPPVLTHVPEAVESDVEALFERYRSTVPADIALLLSHFTLNDVAMRVVGVGSVGTRCYILILSGPAGEPLILQVKEAQRSVLQNFGGAVSAHDHASEGQRVVDNQRILQAVSDSFLGHLRFGGRDFYVRQFRDMKGSIDASTLPPSEFRTYVAGCGTVLARAHAQSLDAPVIAGYLGGSREFDEAVVDWSFAYADQSLGDFEGLRDAVSRGDI
ncbi:DUF2252 domain-containing protein [Herbiconiux sp. CPCC 205763]|uniref:DUF2252 domain-containing protein n=1 Tax=Herbiconiux aconitum TaxID=2970913 RepID=A0ABT2GM94_9MICO|nr:DUF2252 domain-containing protein [Herbiconiux aconitum]MCS5717352.1 DUF2252 domain-containing protein [Herbiconiux aconitum]